MRPSSNITLHVFLKAIIGFDSVDDESRLVNKNSICNSSLCKYIYITYTREELTLNLGMTERVDFFIALPVSLVMMSLASSISHVTVRYDIVLIVVVL